MNYFLLILLWIAYFAVHSLLISTRMTAYMQATLKGHYRFYRLAYNLFSFIGLGALWLYADSFPRQVWVEWDGLALNALRATVALCSAVVLALAVREYDMLHFMGIRQLAGNQTHRALTTDGGIKRTGILGLVRHPMYAALFPLIWLRTLTTTTLIENVLICAYLVVGTRLEEQKLVREHGSHYTDYQQQVSMFFPWKWLVRSR